MSYLIKEIISSSLFWILEDKYSTTRDGRGGVGTRATQFSSQEVDLGIDRKNGFLLYIRFTVHHRMWHNILVEIIQVLLLVVI